MKEVVTSYMFKEAFLGPKNRVLTHLQFEKDTRKWPLRNAKNIIIFLKCFEVASRLQINLKKAWLFGIKVNVFQMWRIWRGGSVVVVTKALFEFLGLHFGKDMSPVDNWDSLVEKIYQN